MRVVKLGSFLLLGLTFNPPCFCLVLVGEERPAKACHKSRRSFLGQTCARLSAFAGASLTASGCFPRVSVALQEEQVTAATPSLNAQDNGVSRRPFAPLEALLPVARLKVYVDKVYDLSTTLPATTDKSAQFEKLVRMNRILDEAPAKLFLSDSAPKISRRRNSQPLGKEQQYEKLSAPDRLNAMFTVADMERQWAILQYQESKRETGNEMRAAFNYYTSRLEFGDSYVLTAPKEERKRMIRNEQLPSLAAVITADLDLRDLRRNSFLTFIEDAKAEISYQLRQPIELVNTADVVSLMKQAETELNQWFEFIAPHDVDEAMNVVRNE